MPRCYICDTTENGHYIWDQKGHGYLCADCSREITETLVEMDDDYGTDTDLEGPSLLEIDRVE